jgi:hypothetical protein
MDRAGRAMGWRAAALFLFGLILLGPPVLSSTRGVKAAAGCDWLVYDGSRGEPVNLFTEAEGTPPYAMQFHAGFTANVSKLAQSGGLDFDGDNKTDPFRVKLRPDGFLQWQTLNSTDSSGWTSRAYASTFYGDLGFGDFTSDGYTDVMGVAHLMTGEEQWLLSDNGTNSYIVLNTRPQYTDQQPFRMNEDVQTDVLEMIYNPPTNNFAYNGFIGGTGAATPLGNGVEFNRVFLGDFNGDGLSDRLETPANQDGGYDWVLRPSVSGTPFTLNTTPYPIADLQFGDFNADGKTDIFATRLLTGFRLEWLVWYGGQGSPQVLNTVQGPEPILGHFIGDARPDALIIQCTTDPKLRPLPLQDATQAEPAYFNNLFAGEVNGDGKPDVLRFSSVQNTDPQKYDMVFSPLLGDGQGTLTAQPLKTILKGNYGNYQAYPTDLDGDALTDIIWASPSFSMPQRFLAGPDDGQGGFTMQAPQDITLPATYSNRGTADLNGDGRLDFFWTMPCIYDNTGQSEGCKNPTPGVNNLIYTALSTPLGVLDLTTPTDLGMPVDWKSFNTYSGYVNDDNNEDIAFVSTCQRGNINDLTCTTGKANQFIVAFSDGMGGFTFGPTMVQSYPGEWGDDWEFFLFDLNNDGRDDLLWLGTCSNAFTSECQGDNLIAKTAIAWPDGTFQPLQTHDLGFGYWNLLSSNRSNLLLNIGDYDGDAQKDFALYTSRGRQGPDMLVEVIFYSDFDPGGTGTFIRGPMEILPGKDWPDFYPWVTADLTGDGKVEQFVTTLTDYGNQFYVVGDLPDERVYSIYLPLSWK